MAFHFTSLLRITLVVMGRQDELPQPDLQKILGQILLRRRQKMADRCIALTLKAALSFLKDVQVDEKEMDVVLDNLTGRGFAFNIMERNILAEMKNNQDLDKAIDILQAMANYLDAKSE